MKKSEQIEHNGVKLPRRQKRRALKGIVIGGSVGLFCGALFVSIPAMSQFFVASPMVASLMGMGVGGALGCLVGMLMGLGTPEYGSVLNSQKQKI